jgi:hypothetical protein
MPGEERLRFACPRSNSCATMKVKNPESSRKMTMKTNATGDEK